MGNSRGERSDSDIVCQLWKAGLVVAVDACEPAALETQRLLLAPLDSFRAEELAAIYADPEVARYIGAGRLTTAGTRQQVATFERIWHEHGYGQSALLERATGRMIGRAGLHPWPQWDELELGYVLARDRWGQGLAREASQVWLQWTLDHLPRTTLIAVIEPANSASITLAERLRFAFDRHDLTPRGDEVSIYRYDPLKKSIAN